MKSVHKNNLFNSILLLLLICSLVLVALFVDKNHKSSNQIVALNKNQAVLQSQNSSLKKQLDQANNDIKSISSGNSFQSGQSCQSQQLSLSAEGRTQPAAGNRYQAFSYQNISKSQCTLSGYPGFLALDSHGYVIPNGPIKNESYGYIAKTVSLNPGDKAYFILHWPAEGVAADEKCINTSLIESTPPGNQFPVVSLIELSDVCDTNISVSPIGTQNDYSLYLR